MNGISIYNRYQPALQPQKNQSRATYWFIFSGDQLLIKETVRGPLIPGEEDFSGVDLDKSQALYLGRLDDDDCYGLMLSDDRTWPVNLVPVRLRLLNGRLDEELFMLAGRAYQLLYWDQSSRFCGRCGHATIMKQDERAKVCTHCGHIHYPRISPAIIIAIVRENKVLLAHNKNFRDDMYSVLAGFMEPGEEFEDTARREVREEVGISIRNIRYFGSQSWPFPDSLMVGFIAEYAGGEIEADQVEIEKADWFDADHLPKIPETTSIAGRMIRWVFAQATPNA